MILPWYAYLVHFFGGALLANGVPHFFNGISGRRFQTPFASPPGVGLSSPVINVLWGAANLIAGYLLIENLMDILPRPTSDLVAVLAGVVLTALALARHFGKAQKDAP